MPKGQKLKVYRTAIGFHDAYVAAPSQKAALEAWGSDANLFARGIAETVTDEELSREPLASPGKVIRKLRGTTEEQIAALPPSPSNDKKSRTAVNADGPSPKKRKTAAARIRAPKPDKGPLDEARRAIEEAEARHAKVRKEIAERQARLDRDRRSIEKTCEAEMVSLQRTRDQIEDAYNRALREWQG